MNSVITIQPFVKEEKNKTFLTPNIGTNLSQKVSSKPSSFMNKSINDQIDHNMFYLVSTPSDKNISQCDYTVSDFGNEELANEDTFYTTTRSPQSKNELKKRSENSSTCSFNSESLIESIKKYENELLEPNEISNLQILPDLVNSRFIKNLTETPRAVEPQKTNNYVSVIRRIKTFIRSNYQKIKVYMHKDPMGFFKLTFSMFIFGFSLIAFLVAVCRDDTFLRQLIYVFTNLFEIKNPFDSIRAN